VGKAAGECREDGHVLAAAALRRGDEENEVRGAVGGAEVHAAGAARERQRRLGDERRAGVRDADAALDARRHLLLARRHVGQEAVEVGDPALAGGQLRQPAGGGLPVGRFEAEVERGPV